MHIGIMQEMFIALDMQVIALIMQMDIKQIVQNHGEAGKK